MHHQLFVRGKGDVERVTAKEISGALAVVGGDPVTANDDEMRELWSAWLAFLKLAPGHDGIRVY